MYSSWLLRMFVLNHHCSGSFLGVKLDFNVFTIFDELPHYPVSIKEVAVNIFLRTPTVLQLLFDVLQGAVFGVWGFECYFEFHVGL